MAQDDLRRELGFWDALTIGAGTMIGAGIFLLAGVALELTGPAAIFSYIAAGIVCMITAASAAELATGMPTSGGDYFFVSRSLGPALGAISGVGTKREIRETNDTPMLKRLAPPGTVLPDVHLEYHQDGTTFGRQLGTYPLLVGLPGERDLGQTVDVAVTGHGYRSVSGVPYPLDVNAASMDELTAIPGVGKQTAGNIVVDRPYESVGDVTTEEVDLAAFATARSPESAD